MDLNLDQKMTKYMMDLRRILPFYSAMYEVLEKVPSSSLEGIGVSCDKIWYNPRFLEETEASEMVFHLLHVVAHFALQHPVRREQRDIEIWNRACDLYVNKLLLTELSMETQGDTILLQGVKVTMPHSMELVHNINLSRHRVEDIYATLSKHQQEEQSLSMSDDSSTSSRPSENVPTTSFDSPSTALDTSSTASHSSHSPSDFSPTSSPSSHPSSDFSPTSSTSSECPIHSNTSPTPHPPLHKEQVLFPRTWRTRTERTLDLIETLEDSMVQRRRAQQKYMEAVVKKNSLPQEEQKGSVLEDILIGVDSSHVNWRNLLRHYLRKGEDGEASFSAPDPRFYALGMLVPGDWKEDTVLKGVKVCVDTSGSVTEEELSLMLAQIQTICKEFQVEGELIYWDSEIQSAGEFRNLSQLHQVDLQGGGGTDPACLFAYFKSKDCKVKPIASFVFTDGYIEEASLKEQVHTPFRNVLWLMSKEYNPDFAPPFGMVVKGYEEDARRT